MSPSALAEGDQYRFRVLVEHNPATDYHVWVDLSGKVTWRDTLGRGTRGMTRWREMICNDSTCPGRAIYNVSMVENLAEDWEARRHG